MESKNGVTYTMNIDENCVVTINPAEDIIVLDGGAESNVFKSEGVGSDKNSYCNVSYSDGNLTITTEMKSGDPKVCKFTSHEKDDTEEDTVVDTKYLHKKTLEWSIAGTKVIEQPASHYKLMMNEFICALQGGFFKEVHIKCGENDPTSLPGSQKTCKLPDAQSNSVDMSCTIKITKGDQNKELLRDIEFKLQRNGVEYYGCPGGFELDSENGVCKPCEEGHSKESENERQCSKCSGNKYMPHKGATTCYKCDGTVIDNGTGCKNCPLGERVKQEDSEYKCESCEAGKYLNGTDCKDCPAYRYSLAGFTKCQTCAPGYEVAADNDGCRACDNGYYNDQPERSFCKECTGKNITIRPAQATCNEPKQNHVYCDYDLYKSKAVGNLGFPVMKAGQKSTAKCPYNPESSAARKCNDKGVWEEPDISACDSYETKFIEQITTDNEASIEKLKEKTKTAEKLAQKDVEAVVDKMSGDDLQTAFDNSAETSIESITSASVEVVSNVLAASKSTHTDQQLKNDIVACLENIALLALDHMKNDDNEVTIKTDSTDVYLLKDAVASKKKIGSSDISIDVDENSNIQNLAALVYKDNSAFTPPPSDNSTRGRSTFIAGKVVGLKHTKKNTEDENISFKMKFDSKEVKDPNKNPKQKVKKTCKYYSTDSNTWLDKGCTTITQEDGSVICECDHMTSFAVILSVQESSVPMWLSNLVLGMNVAFCVLTLLCTLPFRTFRVRKMTVIQSHSILSLFLLCVTWLIMQDLDISENKPAYESKSCKALAFITHYFLMATFSWIFCCSLTLKSQIVDAVKSFGKKNKNQVKKCMMFGYGFPLVIPSLALLLEFLMNKYSTTDVQIHYIRELECWYEEIWVYSFILFPIYIFLFINIICFIKIMRVIGNARRSNDGSSERRVVKAGFALAFTQGLPWIMHPGALTGGAAEVFQYLFLITFGLQGIGLFVFNVLFQEEVLKNLCSLLHVKPPLIFLSVVPSKQRRTPNSQTGETSLGTARNSTGTNDKCYSNNLTLNSVATVAIGEKSLYADTSLYNELHESSIVTEHDRGKNEDLYSHLNEHKTMTRESGGLSPEPLGEPPVSPRFVTFVAGTRAYGSGLDGQRSPIPGEIEVPEHQGPPLM